MNAIKYELWNFLRLRLFARKTARGREYGIQSSAGWLQVRRAQEFP